MNPEVRAGYESGRKSVGAAERNLFIVFLGALVLTMLTVDKLSLMYAIFALLCNTNYALVFIYRISSLRRINRKLGIPNPPILTRVDLLLTDTNKKDINSWLYRAAFFTLVFSYISMNDGINVWSISFLGAALIMFGLTWLLIASFVRHTTHEAKQGGENA